MGNKLILFRIQGKNFAIETKNVKKVIKNKKGSLKIESIEGAPLHIIGVAEVEISQNQRELITFVDFKKIIDMRRLDENDPSQKIDEVQNIENEEGENSKITTESKEEKNQIYQEKTHEGKLFMILFLPEKKYIGVLIDEVLGIKEIDEVNADMYPPPSIKGIKDLFRNIAILHEDESKVFIIRPEKISEFIEME